MDTNEIIALNTFLNKYPEDKSFKEIISDLYLPIIDTDLYERAEIYADYNIPFSSIANLIEDLFLTLNC